MKRRKVIGAVVAYIVAAAGVIGLSGEVVEALHLPDAVRAAVVLSAAAGLPIVAILAWVYDVIRDPADVAAGSRVPAPAADAGLPAPASSSAPGGGERAAVGRPRAPLPFSGTPFFGRTSELAELTRLLADPASRFVTVTGPGGVGKSRLAVRAAEETVERLRDGAAYVALAGLSAPELLAGTLAQALGVPASQSADPVEPLLDFLREKQMLLVLDDFEHLIVGADLLLKILAKAPGVKLLVTSRERVNLQIEALFTLDGLSLRPGEAQRESEAVEFFVASARRQERRFRIEAGQLSCVQRLCELLGANPLALELASSWVRVLSCREILAELERGLDMLSSLAPDLPARHRSLRATFDASWRLLSPEERMATARLALFRAPFEREAARAVAGADLALLRGLLDKSLLAHAGELYRMPNVVRQYAFERLSKDRTALVAARDAHMRHFAGLLVELEPALARSQPQAVARATAAIDDVRAAWSHACATVAMATLDAGVHALFSFYEVRGWAREGVDALERARHAIEDGAPPAAESAESARLLARIGARRGALMDRLGEHAAAAELLGHGISVARAQADEVELIFALQKLGVNAQARGAYEEAEAAQREACELARARGDAHCIGWSLMHLGNVAWARGEYEPASRLYNQALEILNTEGDRQGMWAALNNLGVVAAIGKQQAVARRYFEDALEVQHELGNPRSLAILHHNLGAAARDTGDTIAAREQLEEALAISQEMGYRGMVAHTLVELADVALRRQEPVAARSLLQRALPAAAAERNLPVTLEAVLAFARLREQEGDAGGAAGLARLVASHSASDDDARQHARELLERLDLPVLPSSAQPPAPLDDVIAGLLSDGSEGRARPLTA